MEYNSAVLGRQYAVVALFVRHLAYARGLKDTTANITDHREFWESTASAHLELAAVEWCKVFGSDREEVHWKKTLGNDAEEQDLEEFRSRVLSKADLSSEQWDAYRKNMLSLRDKLVAHLDLRKPFNESTPIFDAALQVAYAYQEWIKWLINASLGKSTLLLWAESTFISQYEQWKAEALSVAEIKNINDPISMPAEP